MHHAALIPAIVIVVIAVAFAIFCEVDVFRRPEVRYLPRWAWAIICLISIPLGGILYLIFGRAEKWNGTS
jgi:Phospholipase_D-nuclease N-terminal